MRGSATLVLAAVLATAGHASGQTPAASIYNFRHQYSGACTALAPAADGRLYGVTSGVGTNLGEIFRIDPLGATGNYTILKTLPLDRSRGRELGPLVPAADGNFYTTSAQGGAYDRGAILRVSTAGEVTVLFSFADNSIHGTAPMGGLTLAADGLLYGTTNGGAAYNLGTVFRITTAGSLTTLKTFTGINGARPHGPPVVMPDGYLYGLASQALYRVDTDGGFLVVSNTVAISTEFSDVTAASDGAMYYTRTYAGPGRGDLMRISTTGVVTDLYPFLTSHTSGGAEPGYPTGDLFEAADGKFYGTTPYLGTGHVGRGFLFAVSKAGSLDYLLPLPASATSPQLNDRRIMQAADGSIFISTCAALLRFRPPADLAAWRLFPDTGTAPRAALLEGSDGHLYGSTQGGGEHGRGTVFMLTRAGELTTLASMDLANDRPWHDLARTDDGSIYGTTGARSVFKLSPSGMLTRLVTFPDAVSITLTGFSSALSQAPDGQIYGVTSHGEQDLDCGTFFKVGPNDVVTRIAVFGQNSVCHPIGPLVYGGDGFFYGRQAQVRPRTGLPLGPAFYRVSLDGSASGISSGLPARLSDPMTTVTRDGTVYHVSENGGVFQSGEILQDAPTLAASVSALAFGATAAPAGFVAKSGDQQIRLTQTGVGTVTWSVTASQPWVYLSATSGSGSGSFTVGVQPAAGLPMAGAVNATLTITATGAANAIPPVPITLTIVLAGNSSSPYGLVDTPLDHATVSGSIAVTGWALDDLAVRAVRIFRDPAGTEPAGSLVFVGNAVMVEGARPDVAAVFPGAPGVAHAGWGYLLLTNMLPAQGDGPFRLHAFADDVEGNTTLLGSRTILAANSTATTPFGAIDTPGQGDVVTGASYANFGWVLARGTRRADPAGGGTVTVLIDGVAIGSPGGWTSRADLTALFPQADYAGVTSALGVFSIDTTGLSNGVHTISWTVTDNEGNSAGIGSRYFIVQNGTASRLAPPEAPPSIEAIPPGAAIRIVHARELQRIVLHAGGDGGIERHGRTFTAYLRVGDRLRPLPFGARIDPATGVLTWQPGVGFVGAYDLTFVEWIGAFAAARQDVRVILAPK